jgi:DNA-directed RNA polymerase specialized sigma24 family protein
MIDQAEARELLRKDRNEERLLQFAAWRTKSPQEAEDLLQAALERVFGPAGPRWDPQGPKSFFLHVGAVVVSLWSNDRRGGRARHEVVDGSIARDEARVDGAPLPDQALDERRTQQHFQRLQDELLAELDASDREAAALFRAILDGKHDRGELAALLRCTEEAVHAAHGRVRYRAGCLLERDQKRQIEKLRARRAESGSAKAAASKTERSAS